MILLKLIAIASLGGPSAFALNSLFRPTAPAPLFRRVLFEGEDLSASDPLASAVVRVGMVGSDGDEDFFCGGLLIRSRVVVTAAHCLNRVRKEALEADFSYQGRVKVETSHQQYLRNIRDYVYYPQAEGLGEETKPYDLALLFIDEAVPEVAPAEIATEDDLRQLTTDPQVLTVGSGFRRQEGEVNRLLTQAFFRLMNYCSQAEDACPNLDERARELRRRIEGPAYERPRLYAILNARFWAGEESLPYLELRDPYGSTSLCGGDSGGPSFIRVNGRWKGLGIHAGTSNIHCHAGLVPQGSGLDVNLVHFAPWIQQVLREHAREL